MSKIAVVLFNLGGPDSQEAVQPFLYNLFKDPAIFRLPAFFRLPLAKFVSSRRTEKAKGIYQKMGGKSPILELTQQQAEALEKKLNESKQAEAGDIYKVFITMRYWHPMSEHTVLQVKYWKPDRVILLPLYPQFSTTTTASSVKDWNERCKMDALDVPTQTVCCYPTEETFIHAHTIALKSVYDQAKQYGKPRILFSAHGLPKKVIQDGDPYQWQVEQTVEAVKKELAIPDIDSVVCYQSRVGPLEWIKPNTEDEILRAAKEGIPTVVVPIAFVSEHSETLVELDIEYKELFEHNGGKQYFRVPALGSQKEYIESLAKICMNVKPDQVCAPDTHQRICPANWKECPCK
jgi:ferrochelatase